MTTSDKTSIMYLLGALLILVGIGLASRVLAWRRVNRTVRGTRLAIGAEPFLTVECDAQVIRRGTLAIAAAAGLVNEPYQPTTEAGKEVERDYLELAAHRCVKVLTPDYEGLDAHNEADADEWINALERAGHSVIRGHVALDRAYNRMVSEEWEAVDRILTRGTEWLDAVAADTITRWDAEYRDYLRSHPEAREMDATIELQRINDWCVSELADVPAPVPA